MALTVVAVGDPYGDGRPPTWRYTDALGSTWDANAYTQEAAAAQIESSLDETPDPGLAELLLAKLVQKDIITAKDAGDVKAAAAAAVEELIP